MKPKIGLITLGVADLARSLAFYRDGLGLPTHEYDPAAGVVFFKLEGTWLGLFPRDELAKDAHVQPGTAGFSGVTLAHNEPSKEGVDAVFAEALAAGASLSNSLKRSFGGAIQAISRIPTAICGKLPTTPLWISHKNSWEKIRCVRG